MKKIVTLAAKLFIITAVATACLSIVNGFTAPIVETRAKEQYKMSMEEVFKEADDFKSLEEVDKDKFNKIVEDNENIEDIVIASKGGTEIGYVFKTIGKGGYGGPIKFVVGVDSDSNIVGYKVLESSETKGFGSQVAEEPFISSVVGKSMAEEMTRADNPSKENEIQAISGTTISVKAILNGLNGAVKALAELRG
ncbi:FMN-binding protein [Lagierella sp.]|uniref:FMN-binding protein n=1 Tax=Lagierella sp. TaxID=2849657 RepID=UPI002619513B|nr:FMN-binding protein [Lagierella sp.]